MFKIVPAAIVAMTFILGHQTQAATVSATGFISVNTVGDPTCGNASSVDVAGPVGTGTVSDNGVACNAEATVALNSGVIGIAGSVEQGLGSDSSAKITANGQIAASGIEITLTDGLTVEEALATYGERIFIRANLELDYSLSAILATASPFSRSAGSSLTAFAELKGLRGFETHRDRKSSTVSTAVTEEGTSLNAQTVFVRPGATLNWQDPLSVRFSLQGQAGAFTTEDSSGGAIFEALNSFSFSKTGPAFFLPEGFTVNAPELSIFDNRWIDPRIVTPEPSPVPLPAGLPLLLVGLASFGVLRRRAW